MNMTRTPETTLGSEAQTALINNVLAIADTKLVLGNWYLKCVHNGRALPDFAGLLGMSATSLGHARALYQYLMSFGCDYGELERGRSREEIASTNLLDEPPSCWEDFLASIYLAEQSSWMMMSGFLDTPDAALNGLARKIGSEGYFHLKYAAGWRSIHFQEGSKAYLKALRERLPLALQWFGKSDEPDVLPGAAYRKVPLSELQSAFLAQVQSDHAQPAFDWISSSEPRSFAADWRPEKRRSGLLPEGLYEVIRLRDPEAVHG